MRLLFVSLCFYILACIACQQTPQNTSSVIPIAESLMIASPDSALRLLDNRLSGRDSARMPAALRIRLLLLRQKAYAGIRNMDSVIAIGVRIRALAEENDDSLSMAESLLPVRGEVSMADQKALQPYLPGAARTFAARRMRFEEAVIHGLMGAVGTREGKFTESMQYLYQARDILESLDSIKPLYAVYMNIGNNLSAMGDLRGSIGFYAKAGEVAQVLHDSIRIATSLMNEGVVRSDMRNFDSSRLRFMQGLASLPVRGGDYARLQINYNLATLSEREGRLLLASSTYQQVLEGAKAMGDPVAIGMAQTGLAGVMANLGNTREAITLIESSIRRLDSIGMRHFALEHTKKLISIYKDAGRYAEALKASEQLKRLSDSLLSAQNQQAVRELEMKYNYKQQEEEKKSLKEKVRLTNGIAIALSLAVLGLLAMGVFLWQRNRYQRELTTSYMRLFETYRTQRDANDASLPPPVIWTAEASEAENLESSVDLAENTEPDQGNTDNLLYENIHQYFSQEKPYINPDMKIDDLALRFGVTTRKITQVIKAMTGQGYSDFVNRYRIAEATRMMELDDTRMLKIDVIAYKSGFSSRQYFRRIFEQVTGVNPSFYRQKLSKQQRS